MKKSVRCIRFCQQFRRGPSFLNLDCTNPRLHGTNLRQLVAVPCLSSHVTHSRRNFCNASPPKKLPQSKKSEGENDNANKVAGMDRKLMKQVGILAGSQLMLNLGFSQMVPVMPMFAAQMGGHLGATGVGLILSAPSAATLLLNVPLGRLCDIIGRKPLMWCGTALTAIGTTATGFVGGSLSTLLACRLIVGAGSASSMTGSSAYISDLSDRAPQHRAKIMGVHQAIVGSVWIVGPAVGGWLAETYGYQNSFLIAGFCAMACSVGYTQLPETLPNRGDSEIRGKNIEITVNDGKKQQGVNKDSLTVRQHLKSWLNDVKSILRSRNQQALIALACELPIRFSCFTTAVSLHASNVIGAGPKELGMLFTALAVSQGIGMPLGSWLADRTAGAKKWMVVPGGLVSSVFFASLAFATSLEQFIAAMAIQGFCGGFYRPAIGAFTAEITSQQIRGQALSLQRQAGSTLSLIGPVSMGLMADATSCASAILVGSVLMMGCHVSYGVLATGTSKSPQDDISQSKKRS